MKLKSYAFVAYEIGSSESRERGGKDEEGEGQLDFMRN